MEQREIPLMRSTPALAAALLVLPIHPLLAQAPDGSVNRAAIDKLDFMVGRDAVLHRHRPGW